MFSATQNKGFQLELPNGWTVSVQFGGQNYCSHRTARRDASYTMGRQEGIWESSTAEMAAWKTHFPHADWYAFGDSDMRTTVMGWLTVDEMLTHLADIRALPMATEHGQEKFSPVDPLDSKTPTQKLIDSQSWK
jgi:hypothetical protein|tara:strand:+ start:2714 stop:3115 length:402 start_codon:yes stop_codon:yes gene_type:complete